MSTAIFHDFEDTIPTAPGAFDTIGDDQAERHSGWGALTGKLTEAELDANISNVIPLHRGFVACDGERSCPPCHQNCDQGDAYPARQPRAAEACTDVGEQGTAPMFGAVFWTAYLALVIVSSIAAAVALL